MKAETTMRKRTWEARAIALSATVVDEDRPSPSRESLDSGFCSSFPASPDSSSSSIASNSTTVGGGDRGGEGGESDGPPPTLIAWHIASSTAPSRASTPRDDDDELATKMPRLVPMTFDDYAIDDDHNNDENAAPSIAAAAAAVNVVVVLPSPSSSSTPTADERESRPQSQSPQPPALVSSVSPPAATKTIKRVRLVTPTPSDSSIVVASPLVVADPYASALRPQHCCAWATCTAQFYHVDDLYDHVHEAHFAVLRRLAAAPATTAVVASSPTKSPNDNRRASRSRRRPSTKTSNDDDNEVDAFRCQWIDCDISLKRGTLEKKLAWLHSHFHARHATKAQPFRCLISNCPLRFRTEKALHAHLSGSSHETRKQPRSKVLEPTPPPTTCFGYAPRVRIESYGRHDFLDQRTLNIINERVVAMYAHDTESADDEQNVTLERVKAGTRITMACMTRKRAAAVIRKLFARKKIS